jgi:hypothetical protein
MHMAGMDGGEWLIANLDVEGRDASLEVFEFSPFRSRKEKLEFVPKSLASRKFASTDAAGVQDQLTSILAAPIASQPNYYFVDASRTVVETCRRGRYHFFVFSPDDEGVEKVSRLARSILQLAGKERAARWAPSL